MRGGAGSVAAVGFLAVAELKEGLCGGYLVLNPAGRPLEFHCTAPVKANRAQEILYGPTLAPYLYGEQIAAALVAKAKVPVSAVYCDAEPILALRPLVETPVAFVGHVSNVPAELSAAGEGELETYPTFICHGHTLTVATAFAHDRSAVEASCQLLALEFDLSEPFERIREALSETQASG